MRVRIDRKKGWIGLGTVLLLAVLVTVAVMNQAQADVPLSVVNLKPLTLTQTFTTSGTMMSEREQTVYQQPERGDVKKILVEPGEKVKRGDRLVEYENGAQRYVTSKLNGTVVRAVDNIVSGGAGTEPLVVVADLDHLKVEAAISDYDILKVKPGQKVTLTSDAIPGKKWSGRVERVGLMPQEKSGVDNADSQVNYPVDIKLTEPVPFNLGTKLIVEIMTSSQKVMGIPSSAVVDKGDRKIVYVVKDGKAVEKEVHVGKTSEQTTEILSGITPKDQVIAQPPKELSSGMEVKLK
ncbi:MULTISPECIES: efflux RND transporter periplasmic adaptor subunit [unclassified Thermoactinomyces]|uniref:efflux RND transporter periplasmic adaptor subunit n=1 Tax=unclassified Thermoactinomyces TaxID=2634588 RepID=UPI0018DB8BFF|nr:MULTISPECIES: efflux RND transporter periplasmic adaptor subunit [unclassified Thermoactinomyces]MBH8598807.1 efflux RND transporter periplasmic adaptor subunit [Thermoactinomyces sp. CICC 10523]MBH8604792.1 efflux RND transporter periplasmic adaptor subunit [Thermoactinomyces sp. CICC 10522]